MTPDSAAVLEKLKNLKPHLFSEMGITRLRVFGSVGRGLSGPESDVDLLVEFEKTPSLLKLSGYKNRLEDHLGKRVDLITLPALHPALKDRILREAQDV